MVPGITAGIAAPAYAGIPVTQRGVASAVALVTGHEDPAKPESDLDWQALAAFPGTLVLYMGVARIEQIAAALIAAGRPASEPAAVVQAGTLPGQRTVRAPLGELAQAVVEAGVRPPAITVVGPVSELAEQISWHASGPLAGRTVAVTRARAQASDMARRLRALGARVIEAPVIRIRPLPVDLGQLDLPGFDLVCLTSPNGVRLLFDALDAAGLDARALAGAKVAVIGPGTARALADHGIRADVVPERFVAEALVQALEALPVKRALIVRASEARDVLPDALSARGAEVEVLPLYETVAEPLAEQALAGARGADYITFTSSSTVRFFLEAAGGEAALQPGDTGRLDRPRHHRRAGRGGPDAGPRSRAPRHRRRDRRDRVGPARRLRPDDVHQLPLRLRERGRVRGRVPRRDRPALPGGAGDRSRPRDPPPRRARRSPHAGGQRALPAGGGGAGGRGPGGGRRAPCAGAAQRARASSSSWAPTTAC